MNRINLAKPPQGNRLQNQQSHDLEQKLTYQQLLNLNHDLTKENMQLKNIGSRLGQELRSLHTQFQIKPREQVTQLYHSVGNHPILHQYQTTLMPLLDAYENKIQQFEHSFEQIHEQFFTLQKKFEEVCHENEQLRLKLTDKIKQLLQVYRNGGSQKIHSDFGQMILDQVNQKQKCLVQENVRLERDYQKYKTEFDRSKSQLQNTKESLETSKVKVREYTINEKQMQSETQKLKENVFEFQIKLNQIQIEKKKIEQAVDRAQSQNIQITKERDMYKERLEKLRKKVEKENNIQFQGDQDKIVEQLKTKITFLQAEQGPSDYPKRFSKLQKQYDVLVKEKNKYKDSYESLKSKENGLNEMINDLKSEISKIDAEKSAYEINESRIKKSLQNLTQKSKNDLMKLKKSKEAQLEAMESDLRQKLEMKDKKLSELEDNLTKVKLERDKLEKQNIINNKESKTKSSKQTQRTVEKLREKLAISQEIFKQQIQIFENDLSYLKKESEIQKNECKEKTEELKKLKSVYEQLKKQHQQVSEQKNSLVEEFRRVRNEYEGNLKDKQRVFEQKIRQVKAIVQESDTKRRNERERVQQSARQYKRVLEDLKATYEARIRDLQSQLSQSRYRYETTPMAH